MLPYAAWSATVAPPPRQDYKDAAAPYKHALRSCSHLPALCLPLPRVIAHLELVNEVNRDSVCNSWKRKEREYLYSAFCILCISQSTQAWITQLYLQIHHACLSFVSVHQMAPPVAEVGDIHLLFTTHLSTPKG